MKICIDARCLVEKKRTGVGEYTFNLLRTLFEIDKKNQYILFLNSWKRNGNDFSWINKYSQVKLKKFFFPNKLLNLFFWYFHWPKIDKMVGGADVVFMPNIIFGSVSKKTKLVITIHDLSYKRYPKYFSLKRRWWHIFINPQKICQKADKIIAVSQSTSDDLKQLYKIKPKKIKTIYSACDNKFRVIDRNNIQLLKIKEKYKLPYKFILYLGTIEPRKNIIGLIRAFNQLQISFQLENQSPINQYGLVLAGAKGWLDEEIYQEIKKSQFKEKIKVIDFVTEADKVYLYNLATLFVYPSFFEGFGFPPLEAMQCGVPTIVSNSSSLPEIVGKAGFLIEANQPDEIRKAIEKVLIYKELSKKMIKEGLIQAEKFKWKKTAIKTLEIFQDLIS